LAGPHLAMPEIASQHANGNQGQEIQPVFFAAGQA
jgi:hypothetical protein